MQIINHAVLPTPAACAVTFHIHPPGLMQSYRNKDQHAALLVDRHARRGKTLGVRYHYPGWSQLRFAKGTFFRCTP